MQSQSFVQPQPHEDAQEDCPCVRLVVKNTFFDCRETQSGLLAEDEREELLLRRGSRKARTCFALLGAVSQPASPLASPRSEATAVVALGPEVRRLRKINTWPQALCDAERGSDGAGGADQERRGTSQQRHDRGESGTASPLICGRSAAPSACSTVDTDSVGVGSDGEGRTRQDGEAFVFRLHDALAAAAAREEAAAGRPAQGELEEQTSGEGAKAAGLLSVGSADHSRGKCKPCAFLESRKGCFAGVNCVYCHACDGREKKRRQKERRKMLGITRKLQQRSQ